MATAKKPTTKRKAKRKVAKKKTAKKKSGYNKIGYDKRVSPKRARKHGVDSHSIRWAAIQVLNKAMEQVFDINKSGLYALGVMKTKPPAPSFIAQQEANDIVEEIIFQHNRMMRYLNANIDK